MKFVVLILLLLTQLGCATGSRKATFKPQPGEISIMTYNVENLFDTIHDKDRLDHTYLPLSKKGSKEHKEICGELRSPRYRKSCMEMDWSDKALHAKMQRLADVILQVNGGRGPDVLILEEVENKRVLTQLRDQYLKSSNYQSIVLIEGPDKRGIDVAFMSRLPVEGKAKLNIIPFKARNPRDATWMARTRGILQATFTLPDSHKLTLFGVHFPSGANPTYWRQQAVVYLNYLMNTVPKNHLVVAGGDFNINSGEERRHHLFHRQLSSQWLVSHKIGCKPCIGTSYYHRHRSWSFLDALLFGKNMSPDGTAPWYVDPNSIGIPNGSVYQTNRYLSPARFDEKSNIGVSDHWPMFAIIKPRRKSQLATGN